MRWSVGSTTPTRGGYGRTECAAPAIPTGRCWHPMWIVRFETVSPVDHPEYYQGSQPLCVVDDVAPEHWKAVAVVHRRFPDAVGQFRGLKQLCRNGELVRNVKLRRIIDADVLPGEDQHDQRQREPAQDRQNRENRPEQCPTYPTR